MQGHAAAPDWSTIPAPTDDGGGTEAAYAGYARVAITDADWAPASGTNGPNGARVAVPLCVGGPDVAVVAVGAFDAPAGGNLLWRAACAFTVKANVEQFWPPYAGPGTGINVTLA